MTDAYSRLYHKFAAEFPEVYADDAALAGWTRLLMVADASWPMRPPLPRSLRPRVYRMLVTAGLLIPDGDAYTLRGLDAERSRRRESARKGAAQRWQSDRNANASADAMPRRERDETSRDESDSPPPPAERGRRADGTNPRANGVAPRSTGTNPRATGTSVRQVRAAQKRAPAPGLGEVLRRAAALGRES